MKQFHGSVDTKETSNNTSNKPNKLATGSTNLNESAWNQPCMVHVKRCNAISVSSPMNRNVSNVPMFPMYPLNIHSNEILAELNHLFSAASFGSLQMKSLFSIFFGASFEFLWCPGRFSSPIPIFFGVFFLFSFESLLKNAASPKSNKEEKWLTDNWKNVHLLLKWRRLCFFLSFCELGY